MSRATHLTSLLKRWLHPDAVWAALPVAAALITLYVIVSALSSRGVESLVNIVLSSEVHNAIRLSLFTSFTSSILALLTGIPIAYALSRYAFRGKAIVEVVLMVPFVMPPIALGATLLIFFVNNPIGVLLNSVFRIVFEVPGIIVAQYSVVTPMMIKVLKSSFDLVDLRYEAVARTLGCSRVSALFRVVLPMARTGVLSSFILGFGKALGEFGATATLAGVTKYKTETLPIAIYLTLSSGELSLTVALIIVLIAIALAVLGLLHLIDRRASQLAIV